MLLISERLSGEIELLREQMHSFHKQTGCLTHCRLLKISRKLDAKINVHQQLMQLIS